MSRTGGVLCLDLSSIVGWCYGHRGDPLPEFGRWVLADGPALGPKFVGFENMLIKALERFQPTKVVMEAPLPANRQGSTNVARQQFGLAAYTEGECCRARVALFEREANVVRAAVLGRGNFGSSEKAKAAVMAWCAAQQWPVPDNNAGDAAVLWAYSCGIRFQGTLLQ